MQMKNEILILWSEIINSHRIRKIEVGSRSQNKNKKLQNEVPSTGPFLRKYNILRSNKFTLFE